MPAFWALGLLDVPKLRVHSKSGANIFTFQTRQVAAPEGNAQQCFISVSVELRPWLNDKLPAYCNFNKAHDDDNTERGKQHHAGLRSRAS